MENIMISPYTFGNDEPRNKTYATLWPEGTPGQLDLSECDNQELARCAHEPTYTPYFLDGKEAKPCLLIFPGGGYRGRAYHEGELMAEWANSLGWHAIVLHYRLSPYRDPWPLRDAQRMIRVMRHNAKCWKIIPDKITVMGFSAGGHLAASTATRWEGPDLESDDPIDREDDKPNAAILGYPVIGWDYGHRGSFFNLLGDNPGATELLRTACDQQVNERTPPCFIWHTAEDAGVPVSNAYAFANACAKYNVPHALHVFPTGKHGLGLAADEPQAKRWPELAADWLRTTCEW